MAILESYEYDNLYAGDLKAIPVTATLKGGAVYEFGSVMGIVTAGASPDLNKLVIVNSANTDGSETPRYVLPKTVDATAGDTVADLVISGEFNESVLKFGGADTIDTHRIAMQDRQLIARKSIQK